ncbi:MAG: tetratricopeptide repeat protein [Pirellulales bacterium]
MLKDDPNYVNADKVYYELAWAQQTSGDKAAARESFAKLGTSYPKSPHAAESWINVGDFEYQDKKDYKSAAAAYEKALAAAPVDALAESATHMLGWSLFNQNDFAAASKRFAEQIAKYPKGKKAADGAFMAGETLFKQDQFAAAAPILEKASAADLSLPLYKELALLHAAQSAAQTKKWEQALKLSERFVKEFPTGGYLGEATYEQAWSKQNLKQLDDAFGLYEHAFAEATKAAKGELAARAKFMAGEILFEQGKHNEAVKSFYKVAYGADPKTFPTWQANSLYEAARCFEVLKNVDQAKKLYAELVATYPESDKLKPAEQRLAALR